MLLVSQGPPAPLEFKASAPGAARIGQRVPITLRLHNRSDGPVVAHFLGRTVAFDIVVTDAAVPSILQIRTLAAGETLEWKDNWVPSAAGRYRIQGVLPSDQPEPRRTPTIDIQIK